MIHNEFNLQTLLTVLQVIGPMIVPLIQIVCSCKFRKRPLILIIKIERDGNEMNMLN